MIRVLGFALFFLIGSSTDAAAACVDCHRDQVAELDQTPHSVIRPQSGEADNCTSCHGEGKEHPANPSAGGVMAFDDESAAQKSAVCAECHSEMHPTTPGAHTRAGLACTDCHTVHSASKLASTPTGDDLGFGDLDQGSAACSACHEDVLAKFSFNKRHRLRENSVTCTSCHDPHSSSERLQLGAFKQAQCLTCHTDKEGPFVFEHAASRVEGCVACHVPHGSANRHLLMHQDVGAQCYSCHAEVAQFHLGFSPAGSPRFGVDTVCTNCHSTIHGSNFDRFFLK